MEMTCQNSEDRLICGLPSPAAVGAFQEDVLGSTEVGKSADLTALDTDALTAEAKDILTTRAPYAIVGGKIRQQDAGRAMVRWSRCRSLSKAAVPRDKNSPSAL
jgi:hypothetical protein